MATKKLNSIITSQECIDLQRRISLERAKNGLQHEGICSILSIYAVSKATGHPLDEVCNNYPKFLELVLSSKGLQDKMVELLSKRTTTRTMSRRLANTEIAISSILPEIGKAGKPLRVLDVGIGGYDNCEELIGITTVELLMHLNDEFGSGHRVFGGDILQKEFVEHLIGGSTLVLSPFDLLNPREYMEHIASIYFVWEFDIVRCSNLLTHFDTQAQEIAIRNLRTLVAPYSVLIYNLGFDDEHTAEIKKGESTGTRLITKEGHLL
ncbi:MAG: hypothetical protein N3H30_01120 [Candidatus Micrarchaeota archaeon]|nr:hypothetical protein [Candidatus Micrarchaeota archaeon]